MKRLLFMLAWGQCRAASWSLAAGDHFGVVEAYDRAVRYLKEGACSRDSAAAWRPIVRPAGSGESATTGGG